MTQSRDLLMRLWSLTLSNHNWWLVHLCVTPSLHCSTPFHYTTITHSLRITVVTFYTLSSHIYGARKSFLNHVSPVTTMHWTRAVFLHTVRSSTRLTVALGFMQTSPRWTLSFSKAVTKLDAAVVPCRQLMQPQNWLLVVCASWVSSGSIDQMHE